MFALGAALFLFVVLGLGVFISTISQNAGQAIQTAFFFLLPQILLSGMIFPLVAIPGGALDLLPAAADLLHDDLPGRDDPRGLAGHAVAAVLALTVMAAVIFTGAVLRFRRDLAPGRRRGVAPQARPP